MYSATSSKEQRAHKVSRDFMPYLDEVDLDLNVMC